MTIHKAKGLEFDVVIVPALGRRGAADPARLLLWLERPSDRAEHELILGPIAETGGENDRIYDYLRGAEKQKSAYENGRLLYVAATRARNSLHLLGTVRPKDNDGFPEVAPPSNTLLADLWPVVREAFEERLQTARPAGTEPAPASRRGGVLRRLPTGWQMPDAPAAIAVPGRPGEAIREDDDRGQVTFDWAGETVRHVGTVVHRMLRRIASEGAAYWTPAWVREQRPLYRVALAGLGVSPADLDIAAAEVERALLLTLGDERGRWILDRTHSELASELPVTGVIDGAIVSGVIDRTFIDARGTRWIIDFKTSTHQGGDREAFLDNERERYRRQMERYALLLGRANGHPVRLGLYFPLLGGWREWTAIQLNAVEPAMAV
jgi:ATP-dependent exoDNAse (exonuclease V) beta subunit